MRQIEKPILGKLNAFWQFVIVGTITFIVVGYLFISFIEPAVKSFILEQQKLTPVVFANRLAAEFLSPRDFELPITDETVEHFERFASHLQITGLVRLEMWNRDGIIVYSDKEDLIGRQFPPDDAFVGALNLKAVAEIRVFSDKGPHREHGVQFGEGLIVNAPITFGNSKDAAGVITIHSRAGFLRQAIDEIERTIIERVIISLAIIFSTLSFIVWRSSRTVAIQKSGLEEKTRELQEARSRLVSSIRGLSVGFIMLDNSKSIRLANPAAAKLLGLSGEKYSVEEVAKKLGEGADFENHLNKSFAEKKPIEIKEISFGNKFLRLLFSPIVLLGPETEEPEEGGEKIIGVAILIEDITDAKRLEVSKNEFVAITSHEMRTPLTIIRGNAELLLELLGDDQRNKDAKARVTRIHESSMRMMEIVNDFLDLTRLEKNQIEFRGESFDIAVIAREVVEDLSGEAKKKNLGLGLEIPPPLPNVLADKERTRQVFTNVIGNAIHYTDKGEVKVSLQKDGDFVRARVADTGVGIEPDRHASIFQKFQAVGKRFIRSREYGSGLGLYIAHLIMDSMGGKIWLEKSAPGEGSVFAISFRADSAEHDA